MSLKAFHIVFMIGSLLMTVFFAYWCLIQFQQLQSLYYLLSFIILAIVSVGLIAYEINFIKKTQTIH